MGLADEFLAFFHVSDDGTVQFRPEDDIAFRYRRIQQWGGQCEAAIAEECVARTCPKFCQSMDKARRESRITECSPEQSCKAWRPGVLNGSSSAHEMPHKAAG